MLVVNIFEAKAKLSEYLDLVSSGERVVICKRNKPIAELRPVAAARTGPRPIGLARGTLEVPATFFEALPDDVLDAFEGAGTPRGHSRVAERAPAHGTGRPRKRSNRR